MVSNEQEGCFKKPHPKTYWLSGWGVAEAADKAAVCVVNLPAFRLYVSEPDTPLRGWRSRGTGWRQRERRDKAPCRSRGMSTTSQEGRKVGCPGQQVLCWQPPASGSPAPHTDLRKRKEKERAVTEKNLSRMPQNVILHGPAPWGFRLSGGIDFNQPLIITRVRTLSIASLFIAFISYCRVLPFTFPEFRGAGEAVSSSASSCWFRGEPAER